MTREIKSHPAVCQNDLPTEGASADVKKWLEGQIKDDQKQKTWWLLAHTEQGVVWGRADNGGLITANDAAEKYEAAQSACPPLRTALVQQARLFCDSAEVLVWRDGDLWQARLIRDAEKDDAPTWTDAIDEPQLLAGTDSTPLDQGFRLWEDGAQGLRHALPTALEFPALLNLKDKTAKRPPHLKVRHYVQDDATGVARIVASRLVGFEEVKK